MYSRRNGGFLKHLDFLLIDVAALEAAYFLAYCIRHGGRSPLADQKALIIVYVLAMLQLMTAIFRESYKEILRRGYLVELKNVIVQNSVVLVLVFSFLVITRQTDYSRSVYFMLWVFGIFFMYGLRLLWKRVIRKKVRMSTERSRLLMICDQDRASLRIRQLKKKMYQPYVVVGLVIRDQRKKGEWIENVPVVADWDEMYEYTKKEVVDEIFLDTSLTGEAQKQIVGRFLEMGVVVHINMGWIPQEYPNKVIEELGECSVLTTSIQTAAAWQMFVKRSMDLVGGCIGLVAAGVVFVIFSPIIWLQSPGPVFFSQIRIGRNGRRFRIYKFRSMYLDAEERKQELMAQNKMTGLMFKMDNDPRITPIGRFMRKYSLDEFPQFWNVLRGDMSLVGTRPPTEEEFQQYAAYHKVRLSIKPGITGLWQISGRNEITEFEDVVRLDDQYIREWSLKLDIKILLKTVKIVMSGDGAM